MYAFKQFENNGYIFRQINTLTQEEHSLSPFSLGNSPSTHETLSEKLVKQ